jgi:hypothetical protein
MALLDPKTLARGRGGAGWHEAELAERGTFACPSAPLFKLLIERFERGGVSLASFPEWPG